MARRPLETLIALLAVAAVVGAVVGAVLFVRHGTDERTGAQSPPSPLPLGDGRVWIMLVPHES